MYKRAIADRYKYSGCGGESMVNKAKWDEVFPEGSVLQTDYFMHLRQVTLSAPATLLGIQCSNNKPLSISDEHAWWLATAQLSVDQVIPGTDIKCKGGTLVSFDNSGFLYHYTLAEDRFFAEIKMKLPAGAEIVRKKIGDRIEISLITCPEALSINGISLEPGERFCFNGHRLAYVHLSRARELPFSPSASVLCAYSQNPVRFRCADDSNYTGNQYVSSFQVATKMQWEISSQLSIELLPGDWVNINNNGIYEVSIGSDRRCDELDNFLRNGDIIKLEDGRIAITRNND